MLLGYRYKSTTLQDGATTVAPQRNCRAVVLYSG